MNRESMDFDAVIVGGGPAGLAAGIKLMQKLAEQGKQGNVALLEKSAQIGSHILSGAVMEPKGIAELFPDWEEKDMPVSAKVTEDIILMQRSESFSIRIPSFAAPGMKNHGNIIISLGDVCAWMAQQAEQLGLQIFPGFAASEVLYDENGAVCGVATGDMGIARDGTQKASYQPGMELRAPCTIFAEGCRGHLGKELIAKYALDEGKEPQHYGIGFKEIWRVKEGSENNKGLAKYKPGRVMHTAGWPATDAPSGSFVYHAQDNKVSVGYVVPLSYKNPHLDPFGEFQKFKQSSFMRTLLEGGERLTYGARALIKGGPQCRPKMSFPGGMLIGDDAGTLNFYKIKGSHTAIKSGIVAAETVAAAMAETEKPTDFSTYDDAFEKSWAGVELKQSRNFGTLVSKFGTIIGPALSFIDVYLLRGLLPFTLKDSKPDHAKIKPASECPVIDYPKPDGVLTFDRSSSVFLSNTNHEEDQPVHLKLTDDSIPLTQNLPSYAEPAQRYCPAGVYEIVEEGDKKRFVINAQNCVHCKTCDIKDPAQNITWVCPEGTGGPNYLSM